MSDDRKIRDRTRAFNDVLEHLNHARMHLATARTIDHTFGLGLDLPSTTPIGDALDKTLRASEKLTGAAHG